MGTNDDPSDSGEADGPRDGEFRGRHRRHRASHGRKGRILHTRISEELSEDIRKLAEDLRVPASNLVRNVLEDVFSVVEQVSEDVGEVLEDVLGEAGEARDRLVRRARERRAQRRAGARDEGRSSAGRTPRAGDAPGGRSEGSPRQTAGAGRTSVDADRAAADGGRATGERGGTTAEFREPAPGRQAPAAGVEPAADEFPDVLGWQPLVLNRALGCAGCSRRLERGERAHLGLGAQGLSQTALCEDCLSGL